MSSEREVSMKTVPFNGKKADFVAWEENLLAAAKRKGYKEIILGRVVIPKDDVVLSSTIDKDKESIKTREQNEYIYSDLILAIDTMTSSGKVAFNLIRNSKS
jgi:hypothetical protein